MIYSKTCEYAVRSLVYLCELGETVYVGAAQISRATGVPGPYVTKIFQCLARKRIVKSRRGAAGGVAICQDYEQLTLLQIVEAIDDLNPLNECAMGLDRCDDDNRCLMHDIWKKAKEEIMDKFKNTKLIELTSKFDKFHYGKTNRTRLKLAVS